MYALENKGHFMKEKEHLEGDDAFISLHSETIPLKTIPTKIHDEGTIANPEEEHFNLHCDTQDIHTMPGLFFKNVIKKYSDGKEVCFTNIERIFWKQNSHRQSGRKTLGNEFSDLMKTEEMLINTGNTIELADLDDGLHEGDMILPDLPFFDHVDQVLSSLFEHLERMSCVYQCEMLSHSFFYLQPREELWQLHIRYLRARSQEREKCIRLISQVCREKPVADAQIMSFHQRSLLLRRAGCYAEYIFEMLNTFMNDLRLYSIPQEKEKPLILLKRARDAIVSEMEKYNHINMLVSRKQADDVSYEDKDAADVAGNPQRKRSKSIPSQIYNSDSDSLSDNWSYVEHDIQINLDESYIPEKGNDRISNVDSATGPVGNHFTLDIKREIKHLMRDTTTAHSARTASRHLDLTPKELAPTLPSFPDPSLDEHDAHQQPVVPCPEFQDPRVGKEPHHLHWTVASFRPRDSVRPRPRYSPQVHTEPFPLDNLRQRMQQRAFRIASMVHLGSSLPLGVVRLADAGLYYDEDQDEMSCNNCSWRMPRAQFQKAKDPVESHSCRERTRCDCGESSIDRVARPASVVQEDKVPSAEGSALPPRVEMDGCVERALPDSLQNADDTMTDSFSSSGSSANFRRERRTPECSESFQQLGSETSNTTMDALLSTGETESLVQQSSSNSVSCTHYQSSAEGTGLATDHTTSSEDICSGYSSCLHTARFRTQSLTDAADQSFSEDEAIRNTSESTYHESHSPTKSCGDDLFEDKTDSES